MHTIQVSFLHGTWRKYLVGPWQAMFTLHKSKEIALLCMSESTQNDIRVFVKNRCLMDKETWRGYRLADRCQSLSFIDRTHASLEVWLRGMDMNIKWIVSPDMQMNVLLCSNASTNGRKSSLCYNGITCISQCFQGIHKKSFWYRILKAPCTCWQFF